MKIAITGGHISPALAVIDALGKKEDIIFLGRKNVFENDSALSYEYQEIVRRKIKFHEIKSGRLQRSLTLATLPSLSRVPKGLHAAYAVLKKEKPDILLSFGGYIGLAGSLSARMLGIPVVIHEQTLNVGLANKLSAKFAQKICISWPSSGKYFPKEKIVLTGNPLRQEFINVLKKPPKKTLKPLIYVTGGSAGSHEINLIIERKLDEVLRDFTIVHQTGDATEFGDYARLTERKNKLPTELSSRYTLTKFTTATEAANYMHDAKIVISRSGINSVTEFIFLRKMACLVPLMHGQKGEQLANAHFLQEKGLGKIYKKGQDLVEVLHDLLVKKATSENNVDAKLIENAAKNIVSVIYEVAEKSS